MLLIVLLILFNKVYMTFINRVRAQFCDFYCDSKASLSQICDIEKDFYHYSFQAHHPQDSQQIQAALDQIACAKGPSLDHFLHQATQDSSEVRKSLQERNFKILNGSHYIITGIVFEPPTTSKWLIKQNFLCAIRGQNYGVISKMVMGSNIPLWFFPSKLWPLLKNPMRGFQIVGALINPLRVVTMQRGRNCIKALALKHICAPKEYLYPLASAKPTDALHNKYVVISEKLDIVSEEENCARLARLAAHNPSRMRQIVEELCQFILHTHLTDMHIVNIRFLKEAQDVQLGQEKDQLAVIDSEPIGGLRDISQPELKIYFQGFDYALFPLLGLRKLQESTAGLMLQSGVALESALIVDKIFKEVIGKHADALIQTRRSYYAKVIVSVLCPLIPMVLLVIAAIKAATSQLLALYQSRQKIPQLAAA
jgi:hypothetical protein